MRKGAITDNARPVSDEHQEIHPVIIMSVNPSNRIQVDVAIIGAGAGGCTATYFAQAGLKVVMCEREQFPRFRIGESLLPHYTQYMWSLKLRIWLMFTFVTIHRLRCKYIRRGGRSLIRKRPL
ncbi:MAG: hypothetical protein BMS9Abin36_1183 [Gammaproteobacteria bacterium]|nr:MAG: hypothetical protein BMS9Abin36_1183 [Gammaproteobacteria bacterium]